MQRVWACVLGAIVGLSSSLARAEDPAPATMPQLKVGDYLEVADRFLTISCKRWVVTAIDKDGFNILQCGDKLAYFSAANNGNAVKVVSTAGDTLVEFTPYAPSLSFPITLGKKWEGKYKGYTADDGVRWSATSSCEVKAFEKVTVPAGTLPAYRIDCEDAYQANGFNGYADSKSWYSPAVGTVVKVVNDANSKWDMQAVGVAIAK